MGEKKFNLLFVIFFLIFFSYFVIASHISLPSSFSVNQTTSNLFNISINNTDSGVLANVTQLNITLPSSGVFVDLTNGTDSLVTFSNNSNVLSWSNSSGYVVNGSAINYFWFNLSNLIPGNYNLTITTVNSTDSYLSNISLSVNDTVDTIASLGLNPVANYNSSSTNVTFNISCSDNYNVSSISLYGNWSGSWESNFTNYSYTNNTWTEVNVTGISEGIYLWGVYCNDSFSNFDFSLNRTIVIDTTNPTISYSCSPSSAYTGGSIACSCSGSDTGSGFNSSSLSYTSSPSTSSTGTYSLSCSGSDYAGNLGTDTTSYSITSSGNSGVTSDSSNENSNDSFVEENNTASPNELDVLLYQEKYVDKIVPENNTILSGFDNKTGIESINISVNNEVLNLNFSVQVLNENSSELGAKKSGSVLTYFHILPGNLTGNMDYAILTIKVNKSWMSLNNLTKEDISLFRLDESSKVWKQLDTIYKESDSNYFYYEISLEEFSYFAIGEKSHLINKIWLWIFIGLAIVLFVVGIVISFKLEHK